MRQILLSISLFAIVGCGGGGGGGGFEASFTGVLPLIGVVSHGTW